MKRKGARKAAPTLAKILAAALAGAVAACTPAPPGPSSPYAPGVDTSGDSVDGVEVGNRLLAAREYELALDAFTRAALDQGMSEEVLTGIGTANIGLGRLGQAEKQLRSATEQFPDSPVAWNNLGVLLMETDQIPEARLVFRKAYALDNGESDSIRDNLRLALAKSEKPDNTGGQEEEYKLVQRQNGQYLLHTTP